MAWCSPMKKESDLKFAWNLLFNPGVKSKTTRSAIGAIKFYYSVALVPLVLSMVMAYYVGLSKALPFPLDILTTAAQPDGHLLGALFPIAYLLIGIPLSLVLGSGLYHLVIGKLFKMYKGGYSKPFTAFVYGSIPVVLTYWIAVIPFTRPLVSGAFGLWGFVIEIIALASQLKMSRLRAFGTILLNMAAAIVIIGIITITLGFLVMTSIATNIAANVVHSASNASQGVAIP